MTGTASTQSSSCCSPASPGDTCRASGLLAGDPHRRLVAWQKAGVFERVFRKLLQALNGASRIDWATADSAGGPLAISLTGGHRDDVTRLNPDRRDRPSLRQGRTPPRRSDRLLSDRGYDFDKYCRESEASSRSSPSQHRTRLGPGDRALGGRAHLRLAPTTSGGCAFAMSAALI